jgi:cathepsin A (carboxypeptidase C)
MGNQAWTEALEWPGAKKFRAAETKDFKVKKNGQSAGVYKSAEGFTFMRVSPFPQSKLMRFQVYGAGHMYPTSFPWLTGRVPYNQPENSLAMFNDWLAEEL